MLLQERLKAVAREREAQAATGKKLNLSEEQKEESRNLVNAVSSGNLGEVKKMLLTGISPSSMKVRHLAPDDPTLKLPVIHVACKERHWGIANLLLVAKANPSQRDSHGNVALHWAVRGNCPLKLIERLVDKGGDVMAGNMRLETPLSLAQGRSREVEGYILERLPPLYPRLLKALRSSEESARRGALGTLLVLSGEALRTRAALPPGLWGALRGCVDCGDLQSSQNMAESALLAPALVAIHNFALDDGFGKELAGQVGLHGTLLELVTGHDHPQVQQYAAQAIHSLCRSAPALLPREVLPELCAASLEVGHPEVRGHLWHALAESSRGRAVCKAAALRLIGPDRLVAALPSCCTAERHGAARLLANLTNYSRFPLQQHMLEGGGLEALLLYVKLEECPQGKAWGMGVLSNVCRLWGEAPGVKKRKKKKQAEGSKTQVTGEGKKKGGTGGKGRKGGDGSRAGSKKKGKTERAPLGGIELLVNLGLMGLDMDHSELQLHSARMLATLASDATTAKKLCELGGLDTVMDIFEEASAYPPSLLEAMLCLVERLQAVSDVASQIRNAGLIDSLIVLQKAKLSPEYGPVLGAVALVLKRAGS